MHQRHRMNGFPSSNNHVSRTVMTLGSHVWTMALHKTHGMTCSHDHQLIIIEHRAALSTVKTTCCLVDGPQPGQVAPGSLLLLFSVDQTPTTAAVQNQHEGPLEFQDVRNLQTSVDNFRLEMRPGVVDFFNNCLHEKLRVESERISELPDRCCDR